MKPPVFRPQVEVLEGREMPSLLGDACLSCWANRAFDAGQQALSRVLDHTSRPRVVQAIQRISNALEDARQAVLDAIEHAESHSTTWRSDLHDLAQQHNLVDRIGSWHNLNDDRIRNLKSQTRQVVRDALESHNVNQQVVNRIDRALARGFNLLLQL